VGSNGLRYSGPIWSFATDVAFDPAQNPGDVETMVTVPAGEFQMGCDAKNADLLRGCEDRDRYLHPVWLDAYAIDKYEVTNKQYRACVDAGVCGRPRRTDSYRRDDYFYNAEFDYFPVLYVSWWDSRAYCEWKGKRLPTEAEWEKAARGAIDTRSWPWGPERPDCTRANFVVDWEEPSYGCVEDTSQVGSFPRGASPYGAQDMSGNVFEWVWDNWDIYYYYSSAYVNPQGPNRSKDPESEPFFVIRGGSYRPRWYYIMTNRRHYGHHGDCVGCDAPYYRNNQVGFRCAASLP
jgi:formylglycine-generating enzyme required for sulfatase activity